MQEKELKIGDLYPDPEEVLNHLIQDPDLIKLIIKTEDHLTFEYSENSNITISGKYKEQYLEYLKHCYNAPNYNSPNKDI